ncbi:Rieske (2Fe-2S) protein [Lacibacterium aquatile]|uniref:Rieske (2Fe-2S) protein n=1 Tax=Lacibacterium aquatile TaxID=1168082 RepID=A0ABW5DXF9_9PROT
MAWHAAGTAADLEAAGGKRVVRISDRQILLILRSGVLYAIDNRCPHEGYPLSEGTFAEEGCVLTCQWHNWKFDLDSGETLIGGDRVTRYPVRAVEGAVEIEVLEAPVAEQRAQRLYNIEQALADNDYSRLAREIARLGTLPGDAGAAIGRGIRWGAEFLEDGMGHAFGGACDWLDVADKADDPAERLAALAEALGHIADESRSGRRFPYAQGCRTWDEDAFLLAMEKQDEATVLALLRGALAEELPMGDLRRAFAQAALAHYQDFGHSVIYTVAAFRLVERLDPSVVEPLLTSLTRSIIRATREDLIPEFRAYAPSLAAWGKPGQVSRLSGRGLHRLGLKAQFDCLLGWSGQHRPQDILATQIEAAARSLLAFDPAWDLKIDIKPADNVGWLDFTHMLTFADAARRLADADPALWPAVILQMGCFLGRNAKYLLAEDLEGPVSGDPWDAIIDHGHGRFIHSVHRLKTLTAAERLMTRYPESASLLKAAVSRYLAAPIKQRHPLRIAHQALAMV